MKGSAWMTEAAEEEVGGLVSDRGKHGLPSPTSYLTNIQSCTAHG